ncbi:unnamed protein product [Moneuplotes crassus]|uniref:Uncharacterized protein n=1 Tax=Euplotes crassus TaxID=5936 RepID=A0AAD1UHL9_EUPCR|nr:unnamed protein product [Moneuplotes crassus]
MNSNNLQKDPETFTSAPTYSITTSRSLCEKLASSMTSEEFRCRTGIVLGFSSQKSNTKSILNFILTPDPEIELEEVEQNKRLGNAEEDDVFRDLELPELLDFTVDEVTYHEWFIEHVARIVEMAPAGIDILGIYVYCSQLEDISKISGLIKELRTRFSLDRNQTLCCAQVKGHKDLLGFYLDEQWEVDLQSNVKVHYDDRAYGILREINIIFRHEFLYRIRENVGEKSKPNPENKPVGLDFAEIVKMTIDQIEELIQNSIYFVQSKHCVRATEDSKTFGAITDETYNLEEDIDFMNIELMTPRVKTILNPEVSPKKETITFSGCVHSKIYLNLDWTALDLTKAMTLDIKRSLDARIQLMKDESEKSQCNIDPCLITEENAPRLHSISVLFPQRIYLQSSLLQYSDHALIWEQDHSVQRRCRSLLNFNPKIERLEYISEQQRKDKIFRVEAFETKNRKIQEKVNKMNAEAEQKLKEIKEHDQWVARMQLYTCLILFVLTIGAYSYVYLVLD